jgi:mycoredoxin
LTPSTELTAEEVITVYGADWCNDCHRTRRYLDQSGVTYRYVDVQHDRAAAERLARAGYRAVPVVVLPSGEVLIEPSNEALAAAMR